MGKCPAGVIVKYSPIKMCYLWFIAFVMTTMKNSNSSSSKLALLSHIKYEHLVAGISGGVTSTLILHPLDLIKIRFAGKFLCNVLTTKLFFIHKQCNVHLRFRVLICTPSHHIHFILEAVIWIHYKTVWKSIILWPWTWKQRVK